MTELTLHLVCGLPGVGKTTRAQRIVSERRAIHLCADDWVLGFGRSLMDFDFRMLLQNCLLTHAEQLLVAGMSVVVEFGSWHRGEREVIRQVAANAGAATELHYLNAPLDELVRRVRTRGGPDAEDLAVHVLQANSSRFEVPQPDEIAAFDRYFGPDDAWPQR